MTQWKVTISLLTAFIWAFIGFTFNRLYPTIPITSANRDIELWLLFFFLFIGIALVAAFIFVRDND